MERSLAEGKRKPKQKVLEEFKRKVGGLAYTRSIDHTMIHEAGVPDTVCGTDAMLQVARFSGSDILVTPSSDPNRHINPKLLLREEVPLSRISDKLKWLPSL